MKTILIKKGFSHPATKELSPKIKEADPHDRIAMLPSSIQDVKPKLFVKEGEKVKTGQKIFYAKNDPDIVFLSPGSGFVEEIKWGKKRAIEEIIIKLDQYEDFTELDKITESSLRKTSKEELIKTLKSNGLWPLLKSLPFYTIPDSKESPKRILIKLSDNAPFYPLPETWLTHRLKAFTHGINVLKKLCDDIIIYADSKNHYIRNECQNCINLLIEGKYPAFHPGVISYKTREKTEDNNTWFIDGQHLITIGETLLKGKFFTERIFAIGGADLAAPYHVKARIGSPVSALFDNTSCSENRYRFISGDLFSGIKTSKDGFTGFHETGVTAVEEAKEKELFGFIRPGTQKISFSRTFLSSLVKTEVKPDCNTHGELRACINCGYCEKVCQVDIMPQFTMKALYAENIELAMAHGLLDCVHCGLCTFVCPSKIDLSNIFKKAKQQILKEEKAE